MTQAEKDAIDEADEQRAWDAGIKSQAQMNARYDGSIAHHLIERNRRIVTETPALAIGAFLSGIAEVVRAWRGK